MEYFAFVTGSTGVLGGAFCEELAKRNCNLFLTGRNRQKIDSLIKRLLHINDKIVIDGYACDLDDEISRQNLFDYITEKNYVFSKLFNVAGADIQLPFNDYSQEKLVFQIRSNYEQVVSVTKFFIEHCADNAEILTVSSITALCPMPYFAIYSSAKRAVLDFTSAISYEYKGKITLTTVLPSSIPTRKDVIEDIKKQGMTAKLASIDKDVIVKKSLNALKRKKRYAVFGWYNKIVFILSKITPISLQMKIVAKKFKNKTKDAF